MQFHLKLSLSSKKRISTLNDYDPTGHISFNEETLKIIEDFMKANILS